MADWFSGDVIANGIKIHYYRTGGVKPPLVLAHGSSDNGMCWIRAAQVLQENYDVIMPDARGHGLSDAPDSGYTTEDRAADLTGLIEALNLARPAIMGHSMGAAMTAMAAARYPDRVGSIVLEDPPWFGPNSPQDRARQNLSPEERRAQAKGRIAEILERKSRTLIEIAAQGRKRSPSWDEIEWDPWAASKQQLSPKVVPVDGQVRTPWSEVVPAIQCPTLLVTGAPERGAIVTPEIAEKVKEMNPLVREICLAGAGHNIRREQFVAFMQAVIAFLAAHH